MARRERRKFTDEYKAEVVALVRSSGKSIGEVSRDLDLTETAVREWVQRADADGGRSQVLTSGEREELSRLRRQVRVLEEERSILKKAAVSSTGERNACRHQRRWLEDRRGATRTTGAFGGGEEGDVAALAR
ncbi:MAG: transposase, partial [Candidatus Dormibacteraeota bacterium]|nr:transposase [Candidatus Dormibacteraeota bacterium]